jgi:hypothetical protein
MKLFQYCDYTEYVRSRYPFARIWYALIAYFIVELWTKISFDLLILRNTSVNRAIQQQYLDQS